jgi:hypothetical protein
MSYLIRAARHDAAAIERTFARHADTTFQPDGDPGKPTKRPGILGTDYHIGMIGQRCALDLIDAKIFS